MDRRTFLRWLGGLGLAGGAAVLFPGRRRDGTPPPGPAPALPGDGTPSPGAAPVVDVRSFGARGDGVTDDTAAVQAAIITLGSAGGGTVYFPPGRYLLNTPTRGSGLNWALTLNYDRVALVGDGDRSVLTTSYPRMAFVHVAGAWKPGARGGYGEAPVHPFGPAPRGATALTLRSPADAGRFAAGDWVTVRTGQTTALPGAHEPDAEINQVAAVDPASGVLVLRWPLAKPYAPEPFPRGHPQAGRPAPFGVGVVTDRTLQGIALRGLRFESATSDYAVIGAGVVGLVIEDCSADVRMGFHSMGHTRDLTIRRCRLHINNRDDAWVWWISTATGTSDVVIADNVCTAACSAFLHLHEGSARVQVLNNVFITQPSQADRPAISVRSRGYGLTIRGNSIVNAGNTAMLFVGPEVETEGMLAGNSFHSSGDTQYAYYIVHHGAWRIEGNAVQSGLLTHPP